MTNGDVFNTADFVEGSIYGCIHCGSEDGVTFVILSVHRMDDGRTMTDVENVSFIMCSACRGDPTVPMTTEQHAAIDQRWDALKASLRLREKCPCCEWGVEWHACAAPEAADQEALGPRH